MKKDPKVFIQHILECIEFIEQYTRGKSENDFFDSPELQDAVTRRIEIIGEAAKNLPEETKKQFPKIPWKNIIGMRDILIHAYFEIDLALVWTAIKRDIPLLKKELKKIRQ